MIVEPNPDHYILILSVDGGWPDEGLVPDPAAFEQRVRETSTCPVSIRMPERAQNPTANQQRYYTVEAESSVEPTELMDALVDALEHMQAGSSASLEIQVTLATSEGRTIAEGTATPPQR